MHRTSSLLLLLAIIALAHGAEPAKNKASDQSPAPAPVDLDAKARLIQKMEEIIIPSVHFENTLLEQAIEFLRKKSRELDKSSTQEGTKGINLILRKPAPPDSPRITLDLKNVPFSEALRYVTELGEMVYHVEAEGVILSDRHAYESERHTRIFKVPPDFLSLGSSEPSNTPPDPFAPSAPEPSSPAGKIPRKSARQILEAAGILFPEGSSARFNPLTGLLKVTNTLPNLDLVELYCEAMCSLPAKNLAFNLTLIEAPGDFIRQINADASKTADASKQLATLLDLAQKPGSSVRIAGHAFIEAQSGTPVTTEATYESWFADQAPASPPAPSQLPSGLRLNLEPTIHADGETIDLHVDLTLSAPLSPGTNAAAQLPTPDTSEIHLTSPLSIRGGSTKLVGISKPPGLTQKTDDVLWAAFITSSIRYVDAPPHPLALGIPSTAKQPKGMSGIAFPLPAGLFESIMEPRPKPLRGWLIEQGVSFPPGASMELKNDTLSVTNTEENLESISVLINAAIQKAPKTAAITLHTVRLPAAFLQKLSLAAAASNDQSKEWQEVEAAAARGEAVFLESSFFEAKSVCRSTHQSARECATLGQTAPTDKSPPGISLQTHTLGSFLQIEPTISPNGRLIHVDYTHAVHVNSGTPDVPGHRALKTRSHATLADGAVNLIALHQDLAPARADHIWATFLSCNTVPQLSKPLRASATSLTPADAQGLETKSYHVSPDFLQHLNALINRPQEPLDPFASPSPVHGRPIFGRPLEVLGVTFPEGASASLNPKTRTLVLRNTAENHALIAATVEKLIRTSPGTVAITAHVLQGPGPLLRRLAAQASRKSNHHSEFAVLLAAVKSGTVLHLDSARLEAKSAARATTRQGRTHSSLSEFSRPAKGEPIFKHSTRHVGLTLELEPSIDLDGTTVGLTLASEFHTSPPFEHHHLDLPLTDYFTTKLTTAVTLPSGTTRLLSLSKPAGAPDLEKEDILQALFITCDILRPTE